MASTNPNFVRVRMSTGPAGGITLDVGNAPETATAVSHS